MKEDMLYDTFYFQLRKPVLERMLSIVDNQKNSIKGGTVFFGDSLIEKCNLERYYPEIDNKYNCGICGITNDILLHFIDEGVIKYQPGRVVVMAGTNDLGDTQGFSPRDVALRMKDMCEIIHYNLPDCKIYVCGCIPCLEELLVSKGIRSNNNLRLVYHEYKNIIRYDYVHIIDVYSSLCDSSNHPLQSLYVDALHINDEGYQRLTDTIKKELLKEEEK